MPLHKLYNLCINIAIYSMLENFRLQICFNSLYYKNLPL